MTCIMLTAFREIAVLLSVATAWQSTSEAHAPTLKETRVAGRDGSSDSASFSILVAFRPSGSMRGAKEALMYRAFVAVSVALLALVVCQHGGSLPVDEVAMDERCDAEDNDGDGLVDEGLDCNPRCIDDCAAVDQCGSRGAADPLCALTTNERSKISPFLQAWCNNARAIDVLVEMTSTEDVLAAEECVEVISDYTMFPWFHVNVDGRYGLAALARQVNVVSLEEDTTVLYPLE